MVNRNVSTNELKNRRNQLKRQRQWRNFIAVIRTILTVSLFSGVFLFFTLPNWVIRDGKQIEIEGNNLLSDDEIRTVIPLNYPQSILKLSTLELKNELPDLIPVKNVTVTKQILPPSVTIQVVEKKPVAVALEPTLSENNNQITNQLAGYIDEDGIFVTDDFFQNLKDKPEEIPDLKIIGNPQVYLAYWSEFYHFIRQSPIKIKQIDWRNPSNLVLITDLGQVYLGGYTSKFPQQLTLLQKMQVLTQKIPRETIAYIDLTDPEIPAIKQKK